MKKEHWPVKLLLGGGGVIIAGSEMSFGGQTSQGILMVISLMLAAEGWFDRKDR